MVSKSFCYKVDKLYMSPSECLQLYDALVAVVGIDRLRALRPEQALLDQLPGSDASSKTARARALLALTTTTTRRYASALLSVVDALAKTMPMQLAVVVESLCAKAYGSIVKRADRRLCMSRRQFVRIKQNNEINKNDDDDVVDDNDNADDNEDSNDDEDNDNNNADNEDSNDDDNNDYDDDDGDDDDDDDDADFIDEFRKKSKNNHQDEHVGYKTLMFRKNIRAWHLLIKSLRAKERLPALAFEFSRDNVEALAIEALNVAEAEFAALMRSRRAAIETARRTVTAARMRAKRASTVDEKRLASEEV